MVLSSFLNYEDWFQCETKSYKILFPKKPAASTQKVNSAIGELTLNLNVYEVPQNETDDNYVYLVNETAYPDSLINSGSKDLLQTFFRNAIDGAAKNVNGKVISEKDITIQNYPGREVKVDYETARAIIRMRIYLVKNKMFMLQTITDTEKDSNKSITKFMDSFQLVE